MSRPLEPKECHKGYYDNFALNLKHYRNRLKMTQIQVANLASISAKYLSLLESAFFQNVPSIEVMIRLAKALQIEPYQLFIPLVVSP